MILHADDAMGKAAHRAAQLLTRQDFRLQIARSAEFSPAERRDALVAFFDVWSRLCGAVAQLEASAPNCAREGYERAQQASEFIEGRQA